MWRTVNTDWLIAGMYVFTTTNEGQPLTRDNKTFPVVITGKVETIIVSRFSDISQCLRTNNLEAGKLRMSNNYYTTSMQLFYIWSCLLF